MSGGGVVADHESHPLFLPLVFLGGSVFGAGLAVSQMARPEIVIEFLQLRDLGLLFVMGGASVVVAVSFWALTLSGRSAPLTGKRFGRRLKSMDRDVILGGGVFGVGWGLSGICPGAAYASLGIGNVVILYGVAGMFVGAYFHGYLRERRVDSTAPAPAD
ncbi:YeeE/YedE family protein [Halorubrum luteum]